MNQSSIKKVRRIVNILKYLQSGRLQNAKELAEILGVSRRTIFRDIQTIQETGIGVLYDNDKQGYWIPVGEEIPKVKMAFEEAVSIIAIIESHSQEQSTNPFVQRARLAIERLIENMNSEMKRRVTRATEAIHFESKTCDEQTGMATIILDKILCSISTQLSMRIEYKNELNNLCRTLFSPYSLQPLNRRWNLVGKSSVDRKVIRIETSSITKIEETQEAYEIPPRFSHLIDSHITEPPPTCSCKMRSNLPSADFALSSF